MCFGRRAGGVGEGKVCEIRGCLGELFRGTTNPPFVLFYEETRVVYPRDVGGLGGLGQLNRYLLVSHA